MGLESNVTKENGVLTDRVLYRDGLIFVIDKPVGFTVHAKPGEPSDDRTIEHHLGELQEGLPKPPALAHRLDRDTSGCLLLGRHSKALRRAGQLFQTGGIGKTYWAICRGAPHPASGTVRLPLIKRNNRRGWWVETAPDGEDEGAKSAETVFRTLATGNGLSVIECRPKTGRTHQIRVHLASLGTPIIGEPRYGDLNAIDRAPTMMLHARALQIPLYPGKPPIRVTAPPPPHFVPILEDIAPQLLDRLTDQSVA